MVPPLALTALGIGPAPNLASSTSHAQRISGILAPTLPATSAQITSSFLAPTASALSSLPAADALAGSSGTLSFFRNTLPYHRIAEWTHSLPKTPTDRWMDVVDGAVRGPNHRYLHHHPVDFANAWLEQGPKGDLAIADYLRHGFLDSITVKGIPLVPEAVHAKLVALGIPPNALFEWTHLNLFDVTVGTLSVVGGGTHFILAITGVLPWQGTETVLITFGLGALQIVSGVATHNPFLVAGGVLDCAAGAASYWHHLHIPDASLIERIAPGLLGGAVAGSLITATRLFLSWGSSTPLQRTAIASESMGLSVFMGTLSAISPWLSLPLAIAYTTGKFAFRIARDCDNIWAENPLTSQLTPLLCRAALSRACGADAVDSFEAYIRKRSTLAAPDELQKKLAEVPDWTSAPPAAEHVFGERQRVDW